VRWLLGLGFYTLVYLLGFIASDTMGSGDYLLACLVISTTMYDGGDGSIEEVTYTVTLQDWAGTTESNHEQ